MSNKFPVDLTHPHRPLIIINIPIPWTKVHLFSNGSSQVFLFQCADACHVGPSLCLQYFLPSTTSTTKLSVFFLPHSFLSSTYLLYWWIYMHKRTCQPTIKIFWWLSATYKVKSKHCNYSTKYVIFGDLMNHSMPVGPFLILYSHRSALLAGCPIKPKSSPHPPPCNTFRMCEMFPVTALSMQLLVISFPLSSTTSSKKIFSAPI